MYHLFYVWGLLALLYELQGVIAPKKMSKFLQDIKALPKKDVFDHANGSQVAYLLLALGYLTWLLIGLLTSQWILFTLLIVWAVTMGLLGVSKYTVLFWLDSLVSLFIVLAILINKYHLHYNLLYEIKKLML